MWNPIPKKTKTKTIPIFLDDFQKICSEIYWRCGTIKGGGLSKSHAIGGNLMNDDIKERLNEVSANLYMVKLGIQQEDNKDIIDNALFSIVRSLDGIVKEIDSELQKTQ